MELIWDWSRAAKLEQTRPAQLAARRVKREPKDPKWYADLSPAEKGELRKRYEERPDDWTVPKIVTAYGVGSEATLYRFAGRKGWKKPGKFPGANE